LKARADMIVDQLNDINTAMRAAYFETDENVKKEKFEKVRNEVLPNHLGILNN
jgi:hypothetical protein